MAGSGVKKNKSWSRIVLIILAALNLFSFPIGTAIGVYTLIVLLGAEAKTVAWA